jgi:hypothetical protein
MRLRLIVPAAATERRPPADGVIWVMRSRDTRRLVPPGQWAKAGVGILSGEPMPGLRLGASRMRSACRFAVAGGPGPGRPQERPCWRGQDSLSASAWRRGASLPGLQEACQPHAMRPQQAVAARRDRADRVRRPRWPDQGSRGGSDRAMRLCHPLRGARRNRKQMVSHFDASLVSRFAFRAAHRRRSRPHARRRGDALLRCGEPKIAA